MKKSVIVTGAGHRVGFHIARRFLLSGYNIIAHYRNCRDELDQWLRNNEEYKACVRFCQADLTASTEPLVALANATTSLCGLVNSASVFKPGEVTNLTSFKENLSINTMVPLELASKIKISDGGFIINITDANIDRVNEHFQSYRISKLFLKEITRQLSVTMAPKIRVNAVAPGTVLPPENGVDESYTKARGKAPLGKDAALEDLIEAVLFLVKNSSITGQVLAVDCGVQAL